MDKEKTDFLKKTMDKLENMRIYRKHIENQKEYFNFIYFNFQIILKAFCHNFEKKNQNWDFNKSLLLSSKKGIFYFMDIYQY